MSKEPTEAGLRRDVLLRFQVALLGMIEPSLRAVTVGWTPKQIEAVLYYDGALRERDVEDASDIEAEVMASFPHHDVMVTAQRLDQPDRPPMLMAWAYWRREE